MANTNPDAPAHPQAEAEPSQRQRLLDAAASVFSDRGLRSSTVADILAASGVGRGSFYRHFSNIEELFLAVKAEATERVFRHIAGAVASSASVGDRLSAALRAFIEAFGILGDYATVLYAERPSVGDQHKELRATGVDRFVALFKANTDQAHEVGLLLERPDELTLYMVVAGLEAVAIQHVEQHGDEPVAEEKLEAMLEFCKRALNVAKP